mmetsp:Transcript_4857/g.14049  ORF Transcript_4857/g.14049 Transcript_4857/m.14049 type:complete len:802 (+) Transcript_4857:94-2499(+)
MPLLLFRNARVEGPFGFDGHGPIELVAKGLGKDLLDGYLVSLAPRHGDPRIHVVDLGGAQGNFLVVVLVLQIHFHLGDLGGPVLDFLGHLFLRGHVVPQVRLLEFDGRDLPLFLLGLVVGFLGLDLFLVGLGLVLHLLGLFDALGGLLRQFLLVDFLQRDLVRVPPLVQVDEHLLQDALLFLELVELVPDVGELRLLRLAHGTLVIAQNGDLPVGIVVFDDLLGRGQPAPAGIVFRLEEFRLQRPGCVVGTKDLGREPVHELLQVVVEHGGIDAVKDLLRLFLPGAKGLEIRKDLVSHPAVLVVHGSAKVDRLLEQHGILTEKLEFDFLVVPTLLVGVKVEMLDAERAASDRVGLLVGVLFPTDTKGQPVYHPRRGGQLLDLLVLGLEVGLVGLANVGDLVAQLGGLVVLESVRFSLEGRLRRQLHVLGLVVDVFFPRGQPLSPWVVPNVAPGVSGNVAPRHGGALRQVERDLFRRHPRLELSHLGMLPASPKGTGGFHVVVPDLFYVPVDPGVPESEHGLVAVVLVGLALLVRDGFLDDLLFLQVLSDGSEIAFLKVLDHVAPAQCLLEIGKEVVDENLGSLWVPQVHSLGIHGRKEGGSFLLGRVQIDRFSVVFHSHPVRHVGIGKGDPGMFHLYPLASRGRLLGVPPQKGLHRVLEAFRLVEFFQFLLGSRSRRPRHLFGLFRRLGRRQRRQRRYPIRFARLALSFGGGGSLLFCGVGGGFGLFCGGGGFGLFRGSLFHCYAIVIAIAIATVVVLVTFLNDFCLFLPSILGGHGRQRHVVVVVGAHGGWRQLPIRVIA